MNFYSTNLGERVFNPFFGSKLLNEVFENITSLTIDSIRKLVIDEVNQFFPFVGIQQVDVKLGEDSNTIEITVKYQVQNFGIQDEINITI